MSLKPTPSPLARRVSGTLALSALGVLILAGANVFPCVAIQTTSAQQSYSSSAELAARRAATEFKVDGDLSKSPWIRATWAEFDHDPGGKNHYPSLQTRIAALWTNNSIYFAFSAGYESLNVYTGEDPAKERWELWERDVVEVFLNPQPERVNHYYEFEVAPNNQWIDLEIDKDKNPFNDASWNSGFEHAVRVDSQKDIWSTEMRIPLSSMKVASVRAGAQWRANFFRAAGQGGDEQRKFLAWSIIPEGKTFHVPTRFGVLRIMD
jgi:alpha-galactosidase